MKKLLLKSTLLLCALIAGSLSSWADSNDVTIWAEDFTGLAADATPTSPTDDTYTGVSYQCVNGTGTSAGLTKIYNEKLAQGTAPELMIGKKGSGSGAAGGYFKITLTTLRDAVSNFVLTYNSNNNKLALSSTTEGVTITKNDIASSGQTYVYDVTIPSETTAIDIILQANTTSNVRVDNFIFTGKKSSGKSAAGLSYTTTKFATTFGAAFSTPSLTNPNSLAVTYSTSDATVADVNTTSGAITIKNKIGTATITASTEGDATHDAGSASYTIYVFEHDGSAANNAYTVAEARTFIANELYNAEDGYYLSGIVASVGSYDNTTKGITYYISDNGANSNTITVFKGKGLNGADFAKKEDMQVLDQVTLLGKFLYYNNNTPEITNSEQVSFKRKASAELLVEDDFDMYRDTEKNVEDLYVTTSDGEVSFESSAEDIAKIEGGKLKALAVGTATITVNVAASEDYSAGSESFKVTVKNRDAVAPEGASAGGFTKITSTAELTDGDYLIVCESQKVAFNGNLETLDATNNNINVTISNNTIASSDATNSAVFTYDATNKTLLSNSGKYIGRTTNSNGLEANTTAMTNTITFNGDGNAVITSSAGPALQFNKASNQKRFRYFTGTQEDVQLYKKTATTSYDITIGSTGYKTLISAVSATLPAGVTAYKAVSTNAGKIQLTSVASIKAGSAYVLKGTASTDYTLTVTDTPEEPTGNILEVSDENTTNGVYVLANGTSGPGFYKWAGGVLGAGRAIVPASAVTSAHDFLGFDFDEETTGVSDVTTTNLTNNTNEFYNLAGQRVAKPCKGLYIVNGHKVIVK